MNKSLIERSTVRMKNIVVLSEDTKCFGLMFFFYASKPVKPVVKKELENSFQMKKVS
jgi:hypothetical protein